MMQLISYPKSWILQMKNKGVYCRVISNKTNKRIPEEKEEITEGGLSPEQRKKHENDIKIKKPEYEVFQKKNLKVFTLN